ncbi:MAG: TIGR01212 family radical SAM protein [Spirochaeta sp.]
MGRFLQHRFGRKVFKIGVDAGFSCPHRGRLRTSGGCSFCSPHGSRSPLIGDSADIYAQVRTNAAYWQQRYPGCGLLLYFQAYTSTLAPTQLLSEIYSAGLSAGEEMPVQESAAPAGSDENPGFLGMVVGTRPDCISDEVIELLSSFKNSRREVWVELGLQSAHESSLRLLNRGHGIEEYRDAAARLAAQGIPVIPHLIFGIPGEGESQRLQTIKWVLDTTPSIIGIKLHNLVLLPGTPLHAAFTAGDIPLYTIDEHLEAVASALRFIPDDIAIMRVTADIPGGSTGIPGGGWSSTVFVGLLQKVMRKRGWFQGCGLLNGIT